MSAFLKSSIIASLAIAIMILPLLASGVCMCAAENPDSDNFSSPFQVRICFQDCQSSGNDDISDQYISDTDGTVNEAAFTHYCFPPVAFDSDIMIKQNNPVEITLDATDPDGDPMTYSIVSDPSSEMTPRIAGNQLNGSHHPSAARRPAVVD